MRRREKFFGIRCVGNRYILSSGILEKDWQEKMIKKISFKNIKEKVTSAIWLPFILSVIVYCLYFILLAVDDMFMAIDGLIEGMIGCIMIYLIWLFLNEIRIERSKTAKICWIFALACIGMLFVYRVYYWDNDWLFSVYWSYAFSLLLPIIYPAILKIWTKHLAERQKISTVMFSIGYFGSCIFVYLLSLGIFYPHKRSSGTWSPMIGCYYISMGIIIYITESREFWKEKTSPYKEYGASFLVSVIYAMVCMSATFFRNVRMREIFFHLTGKAVHIPLMDRTGWLTYRMAAVHDFFSGNTELLDSLYGRNDDQGYQLLEYTYSQGGIFFRQGRWWLLIFCVLVILIAVILLQQKWNDSYFNRCKNYLAAGYLIRLAWSVFCLVGMFESYTVDIPFTSYALIDVLILAVFLKNGSRGGM